MALSPGTRLGPYEILAPLGAGGMGEVYRARDTRLGRDVAIKVLPEHLSGDPGRRERFEREARAVSSLNHPNICTLHDIGTQDGAVFLVMEHLDGETLAHRLEKGPLPPEEVLRVAVAIADALDKAHRKGVVHRDLKPGNIILTKSGAKLLDFGLAKLRDGDLAPGSAASGAAGAGTGAAGSWGRPQTGSILATATRHLTAEGTILGTFQYMAPEQLEGKEADARTDLFAFGTVLYEMVTGRKAFEGTSQASLIAAILKEQPRPISEIEPLSPPGLDRIVRACLAKDPDDRFQTAHDVKLQLQWVAEGNAPGGSGIASGSGIWPAGAVPGAAANRGRERIWIAAAGLLALLAAGLGAALLMPRATLEPSAMTRFSITQSDKLTWRPWNSMAVSPDGRRLVFFGDSSEGASRLWLRTFDSLDVQALPGTEVGNASFPFWSPDSRSIGFFAGGKLKRIDITGGPPIALCDAPDGRGGSWGADGTILFAASPGAGLMRLPASGGTPQPVTTPDKTKEPGGHFWPSFLPDGRHFIFQSLGTSREDLWVNVGSIDGSAPKRLFAADSAAVFAAPGSLLFMRGNTLLAQPFDLARLEGLGDPMPLMEKVSRNTDTLYAAFSVSQTGVLIYRSGSDLQRQIGLVDRAGHEQGRIGPTGDVGSPALSPDGMRLAIDRVEPNAVSPDLWIIDLKRGTSSRLTFEPSIERSPLWSPDGASIYFYGQRQGADGIYVKAADGATPESPVLLRDLPVWLSDITRDGKDLVYVEGMSQGDIWILPLTGDRKPHPYMQTPFNEGRAKVSPDGRWLVYESDESGRSEIYLQTFPQPGGKWQVSTAGGAHPRWSADGREVYYLAIDRSVMSVPVKIVGATLELGLPQALFKMYLGALTAKYRYTEIPGGKGFYVAVATDEAVGAPIDIVLNWTGLLRR